MEQLLQSKTVMEKYTKQSLFRVGILVINSLVFIFGLGNL